MTIQKTQDKSVLWVEKYRPQTIAECILPTAYRINLEGFISKSELPNIVFSGPTGVGKTTVAQALVNDFGLDSMLVDATLTPNVDGIRERVISFASTRGLTGDKAIIFDEADLLNKRHSQPTLARCIEKFPRCRYVLTCNDPKKIIPSLKSRVIEFDFQFTESEHLEVQELQCLRACEILDKERISFQQHDVKEIVSFHYPDFRQALIVLHNQSVTGTLLPMRKVA
ncbi:AAA family ATPase [uncultured Pseudoteredinibacter sp.]|uniref:AAA family ATPase n=1 Tax=uncultured Pseudoteredinibacter sp. TaxID=1641701 RepID=UPI00262EA982|nr:AAA family ATPase [uncultured Pseudoteredinibacter sp.]